MEGKKIELSIDESFTMFNQSCGRVKYFSCITDNLNTTVLPKEWSIKNASGLAYQIGDLPKNKEDYIINAYKHFMQRYLVRDCIESFALSLDNMFFCLLLIGKQIQAGQTLHCCLLDEEKAIFERFQKAGISSKEGKVQILEKKFNLKLNKDQHKVLSSLKDIRNCLAHTNGIVRATDGRKDKPDQRKFHWAVFSIFGVGIESGKKIEIEIGKTFDEAVNVCMKLENISRSYQIGKPVFFNSSETFEIAWSLQLVAQEYFKQINELLKKDVNK